MKLLILSDLHLEIEASFTPIKNNAGDVLILAGDITTFDYPDPLEKVLAKWRKPVLYIPGNHEYYVRSPMQEEETRFWVWLKANHPQVIFMQNESLTIKGVHFFAGTMWTDFRGANPVSMLAAREYMNDYRWIWTAPETPLIPEDTVRLHQEFKERLLAWFALPLEGPRVVITHHSPVPHPPTRRLPADVSDDAYLSLDMMEIIHQHQPALWVYGHTHLANDTMVGNTRVVSNPRGYPQRFGGFECKGFVPTGLSVEV